MNTIHSEIRTNYHNKNFTLIVALKERRGGGLSFPDSFNQNSPRP